jgi:hypothetical protein
MKITILTLKIMTASLGTKSIIGKPLPRFAAKKDLMWSAFLRLNGLTLGQLSKIIEISGIVFFKIIHSVVVSPHET